MRDAPTHPAAHGEQCLPGGMLGAVCDASPLPMWIYDARSLCVLAVNGHALEYFGCRREHFRAIPLAEPETAPERGFDRDGDDSLLHHRKPDGTILAMRIGTSAIETDGRQVRVAVAVDAGREGRSLAESERRRRDLAASESALRRSEGRFHYLFETASDWYWEQDAFGRFTLISPNFEAVFGVPAAVLLGKRLNDLAAAEIGAEAGEMVLAAFKARQPYRDFSYAHTLADGRVLQIESSAVPMSDGDGQFRGYCGVAKDVTAQVESRRALHESERQFRELFETAADWYWESDVDGYATFLSPNYQAAFGLAPAEMLGKRLYENPTVSIEPEMGKMLLYARREERSFRDFVYSRTFPDGKRHWFKLSAAPLRDLDGKFRGYRGIGAEITKSVEAEAAARLALSRLDEAVAHVTQPFVVFGSDDRAIAFNQAFIDLHRNPGTFPTDVRVPATYVPVQEGVSLRTLIEWHLRTGFYAEGPGAEAIDAETLLAAHRSDGEHTFHLGDGRWMLVTYRRLPGDARVGLWSDITAIKVAEQDRRRLEAHLHHSQRLEALGTLAGGVAHEINNALVPVLTLTKMTARTLPPDSRERRNLEIALEGTERIRNLVKRVLAFSRKEEHRRESVDVASVVGEVMAMMRATVPSNIRLETAIVPAPAVMADPGQLHQVIVNLVSNAAQAIGHTQGSITVSLRPEADGSQLRLAVADTGCGMDAATLARVFEPFFTTKQVGEGTGLGLSVVHGIVKDHGGHIEVTSEPGRNTRFEILLPTPAPPAGAAA
jgi:PAS domain S-box-containing protein